MTTSDYIEALSLSGETLPRAPVHGLESVPVKGLRDGGGAEAATSPSPEQDAALVDCGSVVSFVAGLSPQQRDDVLFSTQLAQRAASGAHDRFREREAWYNKYVEVLGYVGWTGEKQALARQEMAEGELKIDEAALGIIMAIATSNQLAVLTSAVDALRALADEERAIRLFDFHCYRQTSGSFQLGAVQKTDNDTVAMALGAFHCTNLAARQRFLFVTWGSQTVDFWAVAQVMTLNSALYAQHRDLVRRKLGATAFDYLQELELG